MPTKNIIEIWLTNRIEVRLMVMRNVVNRTLPAERNG